MANSNPARGRMTHSYLAPHRTGTRPRPAFGGPRTGGAAIRHTYQRKESMEMSSDKNFVDFIVEQIENAGQITYRKMFGEYTPNLFKQPTIIR